MSGIQRIVVGVDGSEGSRHALAWAVEEARHHQAELTAVTAWTSPTPAAGPGYGGLRPGRDFDPQQEATEILDKMLAEVGDGDRVQRSIEEGTAAKVLIDRSDEVDLVVVGSRGYGGFKGMLLGSVSQHVAAHAACPVVVIR